MKFNIERKKILPSLQAVCSVIDKKSSLPIFNNILINLEKDYIKFTGTDLEVEITSIIDYESQDTGEITISARKLLDICRNLSDDSVIEFSLNKEKMLIKSGKTKFSLNTLPASDFSTTEKIDAKITVTLPQIDLKNLIENSIHFMAQQDVRYYLNGILLELEKGSLKAVATNGHRLSLNEITEEKIQENIQIIIPKKGVMELNRLLDKAEEEVTLQISDNHVRLSKGSIQFTSKLIDGKFPDYTKVIPQKSDHSAKINLIEFKQALSNASILSNEKYKGVRLSLKNNSLHIFALNPEKEEAEEEIVIEYEGEEMDIGFNVTYLLDALRCIPTEHVIFDLSDTNSSCLILPDSDSKSKYIVMPMKI